MGRHYGEGVHFGKIHIPQELLDRALSGEAAARDELWRMLMSFVVALARAIGRRMRVRDPDILDVASEVVLRFYRRPESLRSVNHWNAWLSQVVRRALIDQVRRQARSREKLSIDASPPGREGSALTYVDILISPDGDPPDEAAAREIKAEVEALVRTMPRDRRVVWRLYRGGRTHKAIAERTQLPLHTVNNIISRMKLQIWRLLEKWNLKRPDHGR